MCRGSVAGLQPASSGENTEKVFTQAGVGHVGVVHQQVVVLPGVHALQGGGRPFVPATHLVDPVLEVVVTELRRAVVVRPLVVGVVVQTTVAVATVFLQAVASQLDGRRLVGEPDVDRRVHLVHHGNAAAVAGVVVAGRLDHEHAVTRVHLVGHHLPGVAEVEPDDVEQVGVAVRVLRVHRRHGRRRGGLLRGRSRRSRRLRRRLGALCRHGHGRLL